MTSRLLSAPILNHPTNHNIYVQKTPHIDADWAPDSLLSTRKVLKRCELCGSQWHRTNGHVIAKSKRISSR